MPLGKGGGLEVLLGATLPGRLGPGKGGKERGQNGHSPSMVSLTAFRFAAAVAPAPLLLAMAEGGRGGRRD